ncbi:Ig-like domain-containing protein [Neobacillus niacini]|uniref:Ig-like domain-containing protein n=1 Tax=Neobacillus niacini TaxID=86668 RepID=UPI00285F1AFB|nr:Ig-like domain-containing protein [Neobacillus niacini]MDR7001422.1 hypothetical protein [Neobacillus niacini]
MGKRVEVINAPWYTEQGITEGVICGWYGAGLGGHISTVKLSINNKYQKSTTASASGTYKFTISKQKSGTTISVTATDKVGNVSASKSLKVVDKTPPAIQSVNKVTSKSKIVTGSAEKYATVKIYRGSTLIGKGSVYSNGKFSVAIKTQKANTYLKVYAIDKAGNKNYRTIKVGK